MTNIDHKPADDMIVLYDYLVDKFEESIKAIGLEVVELIKEHGLCHHNMHDLIEALKMTIAKVTILNLPKDIAEHYSNAMLFEVIGAKIGEGNDLASVFSSLGIDLDINPDENTTGTS